MPIVKTHKTRVPSMDGVNTVPFVQKINVDKSGHFTIKAPEHLLPTLDTVRREKTVDGPFEDHVLAAIPFNLDNGFIGPCSTLEAVERDWTTLMARAKELLTNQARVKVLLIKTQMDVTIVQNGMVTFTRQDISFSKTSPTLGLDFRVCYQVDDELMDENNAWISKDSKDVVIPYTPEREAFLAQIVENLERAALQVEHFCKTVKEDPASIDTLFQNSLLLAQDPGAGVDQS